VIHLVSLRNWPSCSHDLHLPFRYSMLPMMLTYKSVHPFYIIIIIIIIAIRANIGMYSLTAAAMGRRVFSFEPVKASYALLCASIVRNKFANRVKLFDVGISDEKDSHASFLIPADNRGGTHVFSGRNKSSEEQKIKNMNVGLRVVGTKKVNPFVTTTGNGRSRRKLAAQGAQGSIMLEMEKRNSSDGIDTINFSDLSKPPTSSSNFQRSLQTSGSSEAREGVDYCRTVRMDDNLDIFKGEFPTKHHPLIFKIDIEGGECRAIAGMKQFLEYYKVRNFMQHLEFY
jgi:FkbM family methyltransferase